MGTNGLEPSTSRLSGVRSNHLSYAPGLVEMRRIELLTPCLQSRCSPSWATPPLPYFFFFQSSVFFPVSSKLNNVFLYFPTLPSHWPFRVQTNSFVFYSLERRWSSRTFRYGYLVTTSPQSSIPPSTAPSLLLGYRLRVLPTPMVWRAVCTRPGNVFTAACWSAITSNSDFMQASCSLQSELGQFLGICSASLLCFPLLIAIVVRV